MATFRRSLLLCLLLFWQGGFTFYTGVVIPVGAHVLGSHRRQAAVTREVVPYLNLAGVATLPVLAWDVLAEKDPSRRRRRWRWGLWLAQLLTLALLYWLLPVLNAQAGSDGQELVDPATFRFTHRLYVWVNTLQWACSLAFLVLSLRAWGEKEHTPLSTATTQPVA
jgi:hypothetical protein